MISWISTVICILSSDLHFERSAVTSASDKTAVNSKATLVDCFQVVSEFKFRELIFAEGRRPPENPEENRLPR